jgi:hypothetical protein
MKDFISGVATLAILFGLPIGMALISDSGGADGPLQLRNVETLNTEDNPTDTPVYDDSLSEISDYGVDYQIEEESSSDSSYPAYSGYDLDCVDIGHRVSVGSSDPHNLDADGDGIGCESY